MSARVPGLGAQDWRTRLLLRHPALFPEARLVHTEAGPALTAPGLPGLPEGWRAIVETLCRRLDQARAAEAQRDHPAEIAILDLDEAWGILRVTVSGLNLSPEGWAAVTRAVDLAEARSAQTCALCGSPGRPAQSHGRSAPRCETHTEGCPPIRERHPGLQVITTFIEGQPVRSARRYDPVTDGFLTAEVPEDED